VRTDGRMPDEVRAISIERGYTCHAQGSVLIQVGRTRVLCTAMVEDRLPPHCIGKGHGWVSAEYCLLPGSVPERRSLQGHVGGRTHEIQRLIGRSLRAAVDLHRINGRTIWVDCNVIQADGGTRTASITGGFVALVDALWSLKDRGIIECIPLTQGIAAVSVGIVEGQAVVDLCADEDRAASVDMNVVMTHEGRFVEVQGTAEGPAFTREEHDAMLGLAQSGIDRIRTVQADALGDRLVI
jgi:ribonuclease PH